MKHLKLFQTQIEYELATLELPNVSYVVENDTVYYRPYAIDYRSQYLTFEALEDSTFALTTNACEYSLDEGETWVSLSANSNTPTVPAGSKIMFKATNPTIFISGIGTFSSTGKFNVSGNVMSMLHGDEFVGKTDLTGKYSVFCNLFSGCTNVVEAHRLILPATTLAAYCYYHMFDGCNSLTTAPELPATELDNYCYGFMFLGCNSLTTAPKLPATTLHEWCYQFMFYDCRSLNNIVMLATDISANGCLSGWTIGIASTGTFTKSPSTASLPTEDIGIPDGWTVVNTFNNISPCIINSESESITFVYSDGLFTPTNEIIDLSQHFTKEELLSIQPECEIIVAVQDKTDSILTSDYVWTNDKTLGNVLNELGVTKDIYDINVIITKVNAPEDNGYYYYYDVEDRRFVEKDWMRVVSLEDDNTILLNEDIQYSVNGDDWRNLNAFNAITVNSDDIVYFKGNNTKNHFTVNKAFNVEGNIMSLIYGDEFEGQIDLSGKDHAFSYLFSNCTTLKNAENLILPATTLSDGCYAGMFVYCTSLITAPELPATILTNECYDYMFLDCTSLITAPELPATTLADKCYEGMFCDCTSLTAAPALPATKLASLCYMRMFYGCTSLTTAPELLVTTLTGRCYDNMFNSCSNLNNIVMLATDISASYCLDKWVDGVASSGTFVKNPNMTSLPSGSDGIPNGWTVEDYNG